MSGQFWFGWGIGVGATIGGQFAYFLWKLRWSRRARAVRRRIAIMEYDLGYSDKPITSAQHMDAHAKSMAKMWEISRSWSSGNGG